MGFHFDCDWLWIDTACINKSDSVELSESINSMFAYYRHASVCYAYLPDVRFIKDYHGAMLDFMQSAWFTRGWTLQELLAPPVVVFLTKDWEVIGHKCRHERRMCDVICRGFGQRLDFVVSRITGIPSNIISDYTAAKSLDTETKLCWIQRRQTTRVEDRAYCLLGLCEVHLAPIYGESEHAWERLLGAIAEKQRLQRAAQKALKAAFHNRIYSQPVTDYTTAQEIAIRSRTAAAQTRVLVAEAYGPLRSRTDGEERRLRELRVRAKPFIPYTVPETPSPTSATMVPLVEPPAGWESPDLPIPDDWRTNKQFYRRIHARCYGFRHADDWEHFASQARTVPEQSMPRTISSSCNFCGEPILDVHRTVMCSYERCSASLYHRTCTDVQGKHAHDWYCWQCRESPRTRETVRHNIGEGIASSAPPRKARQAGTTVASSTAWSTAPQATIDSLRSVPPKPSTVLEAGNVGSNSPSQKSQVIESQTLSPIDTTNSKEAQEPTSTKISRMSSVRRRLSLNRAVPAAILKGSRALPIWTIGSFTRSAPPDTRTSTERSAESDGSSRKPPEQEAEVD